MSTARPTPIPHLGPPIVVRRAGWQDGPGLRVSTWPTPRDLQEPIDIGLHQRRRDRDERAGA